MILMKTNLIYSKIWNSILTIAFVSVLFLCTPREMIVSNIVWCVVGVVSLICIFSPKYKPYIKCVQFYEIIVLNIVISIGLLGNTLLFYPINEKLFNIKIIEYCLFYVSCTPISLTLMSATESLGGRIAINKLEGHYTVHYLIFFAETMIVGGILMYAFNPCIVSFDAGYSIAEALGLRPISEYRGILYVLILKILLSVCKSEQFLCICQIIMFGGVFAFFFSYLEKEFNMRFSILFICYSIFLLFPSNMMLLITINKDVYYSIDLVLLAIAFLYLRQERNIRIGLVLLSSSMFLTFTIRQSGMIVVAIVSILGMFFFKKNIKVIVTMFISVLCGIIFTFSMPGILERDSIELELTPWGMGRVALFQDILGVYYSGGDLSYDTIALIEHSVGDDIGYEEVYSPYWAYHADYYEQIGDIELKDFLVCYVDTFLRNPVLMGRSIMLRNDMIWDFRPGIEAIEQGQWKTADKGGDWYQLFEIRKENYLTHFLNQVGEKSKSYPLKEVLWRVGEWNLLLVICFLYTLKHSKKYLAIFIPIIGYIISYILTLGWSTYRYFWADELMTFVIFLSVLGIIKKNSQMKCVKDSELVC